MNTTTKDLYQSVTDSIIAMLENGVRPWHCPWTKSGSATPNGILPLRSCGTPYAGVNVLLLWEAAMRKGYKSQTWMTYKQAEAFGAHVRKGEKSTTVVYADRFIKKSRTESGEEIEASIPFLKAYCVFNVDQIDGLPERFHGASPAPVLVVNPDERIASADSFVNATGAVIREAGDRACYSPSIDQIAMPPFASFESAHSFYSTEFHELIHWTMPADRLNRQFEGGKRFGDEGYAMEELVAEIGAAFLCASIGITPTVREDHASYVAHWLRVLKNDKRAVFTAASAAQKAAEYLHAFQATQAIAA